MATRLLASCGNSEVLQHDMILQARGRDKRHTTCQAANLMATYLH